MGEAAKPTKAGLAALAPEAATAFVRVTTARLFPVALEASVDLLHE